MKPVMVVAGTRPEVIKLAPIIEWFEKLSVEYIFVWSGQHYDRELSKIFFEQFKLPEPNEDLRVGSGTHAEQTTNIMLNLEKLIKKYSPAIITAVGDTNTVVASSLTSLKCQVPFAHIEAGLRSWNMMMPEEVNRKVADAIATIHFAPTKLATINLIFEGISRKTIYLTGNTIVDVVYKHKEYAMKKGEELLASLGLNKNEFILLTLHRAENTDSQERLRNILLALLELSQYYEIVFPLHPRTKNAITKYSLTKYLQEIKTTEPLGYFEFLGLLANSKVVLTDSGGVQEEAFTLKVPTVTLRYNTERPETTLYGLNKLAGAEKERIIALALNQADYSEKAKTLQFENPLGDGHAGERIARILKEIINDSPRISEPDLRDTPILTYRLLDDKNKFENGYEIIVGFSENGNVSLSNKNCNRFLARTKIKHDKEDSPNSK
jgi:UDP-N-acetylglucosamine 2-epimerase (non-hydrolysing)